MVPMQISDVQDEIDHELITKNQIASKISEVAALVSEDYRGVDLLLIAVLKSYGSGTTSTGDITIRQDLSTDVRGRHILIVEDIVDSGHTLAWLKAELLRRSAASVEVFALLEKPSRREVDVDVKYRGYEIPDEFVVGFGLDYDERFRNLDSIAVLKPEVYQGEHA